MIEQQLKSFNCIKQEFVKKIPELFKIVYSSSNIYNDFPQKGKTSSSDGLSSSNFLAHAWDAAYLFSETKSNSLGYLVDAIISSTISEGVISDSEQIIKLNEQNNIAGDAQRLLYMILKKCIKINCDTQGKCDAGSSPPSLRSLHDSQQDKLNGVKGVIFESLVEDLGDNKSYCNKSYYIKKLHQTLLVAFNEGSMNDFDCAVMFESLQACSTNRKTIDGKSELDKYVHLILYIAFFSESADFNYSVFCSQFLQAKIFKKLTVFWKGFIYWHAGERKKADKYLYKIAKVRGALNGYKKMAILLLTTASNLSFKKISALYARYSQDVFRCVELKGSPDFAHVLYPTLSKRPITVVLNELNENFANEEKRIKLAEEIGGALIKPERLNIDIENARKFFVYYKESPMNIKNDYSYEVMHGLCVLLKCKLEDSVEILPTLANAEKDAFLTDVQNFLKRNEENIHSSFFSNDKSKPLFRYMKLHKWDEQVQKAIADLIESTTLWATRFISTYVEKDVCSEINYLNTPHDHILFLKIPDDYLANKPKGISEKKTCAFAAFLERTKAQDTIYETQKELAKAAGVHFTLIKSLIFSYIENNGISLEKLESEFPSLSKIIQGFRE